MTEQSGTTGTVRRVDFPSMETSNIILTQDNVNTGGEKGFRSLHPNS